MDKKGAVDKTKKLFYTFLDAIILICFALAVYFTLIEDYERTILFLVIGTLLLMFFIVRGVAKHSFLGKLAKRK